MKTTIKYLMLTLVAVFACVLVSSCSNEDDDFERGVATYYLQLKSVSSSNLVDANGRPIEHVLMERFISENNWDADGKIAVGKTDRAAAEAFFDNLMNSVTESATSAWRGKMWEGAYIRYTFCLYADESYIFPKFVTVEITNSGAIKK